MSNFMNAVNKQRRAHWLATHHLRPLAKVYVMWIYLIHNSFIPADCEIGEGTTFGYKAIGANVVMMKDAPDGIVWGFPRKCCGIKTAIEWNSTLWQLGRCVA